MASTSDGIDRLMGGQLLLRQPAKGHRAGTDSMLLAAAGWHMAGQLVDVGAGVGTVGLAMALRQPQLQMTLVEISPDVAEYARQNVTLNQLGDRVGVIETDVLVPKLRRAAGLPEGRADGVVSNPPYFEAGQVRASHNKARAHVLEAGDLTRWIAACLALLRPGGSFVMIHRPQALPEILAASAGRMGAMQIVPVYPRAGKPAGRILVHGRRGSRAAPAILPGLVVHEADGGFSEIVQAIHRGETEIPGFGR